MKFDTPIFQLKRDAKHLARDKNIPLHRALDQIALEQGFKNWSHLTFLEQQERSAATLMKNLEGGDFVLLGARPRQGKTMLALKLLSRAVQTGLPGYFFTLEYAKDEVWQRLNGFDLNRACAMGKVHVDTSDNICADYICRQLQAINRPGFVVIDYMQLLDQKRENPELDAQVSQLSVFSKRTGSIIIALSQIDRQFDPSDERLPDTCDVRLPNPVDLSSFTKTCFLHEGRVAMGSNP